MTTLTARARTAARILIERRAAPGEVVEQAVVGCTALLGAEIDQHPHQAGEELGLVVMQVVGQVGGGVLGGEGVLGQPRSALIVCPIQQSVEQEGQVAAGGLGARRAPGDHVGQLEQRVMGDRLDHQPPACLICLDNRPA